MKKMVGSIAASIAIMILAAYCDESSSSSSNNEELDLVAELTEVDNVLDLPSSDSSLQGKVVDGDDDGTGDGIDLSGDGVANISYALDVKSATRATEIEFTIEDNMFIFTTDGQNILILSADGADELEFIISDNEGTSLITGLGSVGSGEASTTLSTSIEVYDFSDDDGGGTSDSLEIACYFNQGSTNFCMHFAGENWTEQQEIIDYCLLYLSSSLGELSATESNLTMDTEPCVTGDSNGYCTYDNDPDFTENDPAWEHNAYFYSGDSRHGNEVIHCGSSFMSN